MLRVPIKPELIGRPSYEIALGKMAGRASVRMKLRDFGVEATPEQIAELTERVKQEGTLRKGSLSKDVFLGLAREVAAGKK